MSPLELHQVSWRCGEGPTEVHAIQGIGLPAGAGARIRVILAMGRGQSAVRWAGAALLPMVPP